VPTYYLLISSVSRVYGSCGGFLMGIFVTK